MDLSSIALKSLVFGLALTSLSACKSIAPQARDVWGDELKTEGFKAIYPPREGDGLGAVVTYKDGSEIVVLDASKCIKTPAAKYRLAVLSRDEKFEGGASLSAQVAKILQGKVDAEGIAQASRESTLMLSLRKPFLQRYETAPLKTEIRAMDRNSQCFRTMTNPNNFILFQVMGAEGVTYKLTDNKGSSIKFTADILKLGKVTPELMNKADGSASLDIDVAMFVGYKAMRAEYLPGALNDEVLFTEFELKDYTDGAPKK